jgi:hypothetical protein
MCLIINHYAGEKQYKKDADGIKIIIGFKKQWD